MKKTPQKTSGFEKLLSKFRSRFHKEPAPPLRSPAPPSRHHVAISGTGRAGTTFLVQLFTELGFQTGFQDLTTHVFENCRAGMEANLRLKDTPYIMKDPTLGLYLDEFLSSAEGRDVVVDYLIVPVRDLFSAAESRRDVTRRTDPTLYPHGPAPGGLWMTDDPKQQEAVLQDLLYKLIFAAAKWSIPVILLHFPRIVKDHAYLYEELHPVLKGMSYVDFLPVVKRVAKPEWVHDFSQRASRDSQAGITARSESSLAC